MPSTNHRRNGQSAVRTSSCATVSTTTGNARPTTSTNIRVVVRIRPPNAAELENRSGSRPVIQMLDEKLLVFDPKEDDMPSYFHGRRIAKRNFMQRKNKDVKFAFDHVFGERVSQQYVYENTTKTIVESVLAGYNASVFAYGATGAGKTFTMLGGPDCPGVIFLTMVDLYQRIGEIAKDKLCDVAVSYLEVYNENISDLLAPSGLLAIREDPEKGVVVSGLSLHKPRSAEELLRMLDFGNANRTQHPTDANAQSSRSHAVFQVFVRQKDRTANISTNFRIAKMSLIDLAGSERATVTTNRGARFREGANINRSLLALGNCINALADGNKSKGQHIPYRNSKLTRLLKDSLGGNCQTVMIAAVSPSSLTYEDTLNTLKYANRAKNIRTTLKQNVISVDLHISRYAQIVEELRTEVTELKAKLQSYETGVVKVDRSIHAADVISDETSHRLRLELHKVFAQRGSIQKELLELESSDRHLTVMIGRKQLMAERIRLVYGDSTQGDKTMGRFERHIAASSTRQTRLRDRKPAVKERLKSNEEWLDRVKTEMKTGNGDGVACIPTAFQESLRARHLEIELKGCRRQIKHLKRFARQQNNHQQSSERLIVRLLSTVRKQFFLLKGSDLATSDVTAAFEAIQKQVEGDREVAWADQSVAEAGPSAVMESDFNALLELPVMKCVETTPKAPSRSPRKRRRSSTYTPTKNHDGPDNLAANQNPLTPPAFVGTRTPTQNGTPASRVPMSKVITTQPPMRLQTPKTATPSKCSTVTKPGAGNMSCYTENGSMSSQGPATTPDVSQEGHNGICNTGMGYGVSPCIGETVTKKQPRQNAETLPGYSLETSEPEELRRNLSGSFDIDGVCPLRGSPTTSGQLATPVDREPHVTVTDQSQAPSLALTSPFGTSELSANRSSPTDPQKPVARTISFDQENALPNQKVSPVTGQVMSYAEALTTPQRLDASCQQRAPFAVLTNNSPQLQNRPVAKATHVLISECPTKGKSAGNQCGVNQPKSSIKRTLQRRGTFTKHNAPLHRRSQSQGVLGERPFSFQETKHAETLHRFGLPSMSDQPTGVVRKATPAYMSLTASAANKRRNHSRGFQAMQENQPPLNGKGPMRLPRTESMVKPAVRIPSFSRSRSASNLHGKMNP